MNNSRYTLTVNESLKKEIENIRKKIFFDNPKAQVIRYLVELGLERYREKEKGE